MEQKNDYFKDLLEIITKLPPVKKRELSDFEDNGKMRCSCGEKLFDFRDLKQVHDSGVVKALDRICNECYKNVKDFCPIICIGCKEVVARVEPGVNRRGFKLLKGKAYHIHDCPSCNPEKYEGKVVESRLVEEMLYEKIQIR